MIGLNMNEQNMILLSKSKLKSLVKKCVFKSVFTSLKSAQSSHSKIKSIKYNKFEMQPYLESELFTTEETEMVFNIRANTVTGYKACFKTLYQSNMNCKLGCPVEDSIEHVFKCKKIDECSMKTNISLRAMFASVEEQREAVSVFTQRENIRMALLGVDEAYQGQVLDTSTRVSAGCAGASAGK